METDMTAPRPEMLTAAFGFALGLALAGVPLPAFAAGEDTAPIVAKPADPDYLAGKKAIEAGNWTAAIDAFSRAATRDTSNADIQNYLGYSYRKAGNLDTAFKHYQVALKLAPDHRGAHEYIGEAYLMKGDLKTARQHLAALDRICLFGCQEFRDLKKAVADYEKKKTN
jgi:tetratricopeptide (TPR) repeat protein